MNFLKSYFASLLGTFSALGLLLFFFLLLISAAGALLSGETETKSLKEQSVLDLNLNIPLTERNPITDPLQEVLGLSEEILGLPQLLRSIDLAASDENIEGIRLRAEYVSAGWAQTHTVRKALEKFKASGKFIIAYGDFFTQKSYFLASVADSIFLNPMGNLELKGLASEVLYYKTFQDKYGARMEVVREGNFKSAVEPFLEEDMSRENQLQIRSLLNSLWGTLRQAMATARNLSENTLDRLAENLSATLPEEALTNNLIDGIHYENEVEQKIKQHLGLASDEKIHWVSPQKMARTKAAYDQSIKDRIAVIYANGTILYGEGSPNFIAQGKFVEAIEEASQDDWVKAIVIRINSPGGNALTSEIIWEALKRAKDKKPLVVSMGNVAASGGYYLAAPAHKIFADQLTITGSIGVFAALPNIHELSEKLGVNAAQVQTHSNALGYSLFEPLSDGFKAFLIKNIRKTYTTFKQRVAQGRSLSLEEVETLAQGRVWTGKEALENGLIDGLGGLETALEEAAAMANIEKYTQMAYPQWDEDLESIL
ncbi:MAG: signal peptide peptidase SppA, partial [Flavobacteriaceae bacterium]